MTPTCTLTILANFTKKQLRLLPKRIVPRSDQHPEVDLFLPLPNRNDNTRFCVPNACTLPSATGVAASQANDIELLSLS